MDYTPWPDRIVRQNRCMNTRASAVVVPIVTIGGEDRFLFEQRSSKLSWQPGDICFPGGAVEAGDSSTLGTALRELEEEIGVPRSKVSVLGPLDYVESPVGVLVWPYAARLLSTDFAISRGEIDHLFTVPVDWFAKNRPEIAQIRLATRPETGFPADLPVAKQVGWKERRTYDVLIYRYGTYKIWGITAAIIVNFLEIVK